jgi:hypothetical protein
MDVGYEPHSVSSVGSHNTTHGWGEQRIHIPLH